MQPTYIHYFLLHLIEKKVRSNPAGKVRILDAGCGTGKLMLLLSKELPKRTSKEVEVHGFDVQEHHYQTSDAHRATIKNLLDDLPEIPWPDRLKIISHLESWPYENGYFDYIVSNQVVEHVHNLTFFFSEQARVLAQGGKSIHTFPTREVIVEPHVMVPFAHRFTDWEFARRWIQIFFWLRFGQGSRFRIQTPKSKGTAASKAADYLILFTNFQTTKTIASAIKSAGLRCTFQYTPCFYIEKIRQLILRKKTSVTIYGAPPLLSAIFTWTLKRIAGVVVETEKASP